MPRRKFRNSLLQAHAHQRLYYDADHVKPLSGTQLFNPNIVRRWSMSAVGVRRLRHPDKCDPHDPLYMMLIVDALMRIDIHSQINSNNFCVFLNEWYPDVIWNHLPVAKLLTVLYQNQEKSGAPKIDGLYPLVRTERMDYKVYALIPERETYIWLGKMRERLHKYMHHVLLMEYRYRVRNSSQSVFPKECLWDPKFNQNVTEKGLKTY